MKPSLKMKANATLKIKDLQYLLKVSTTLLPIHWTYLSPIIYVHKINIYQSITILSIVFK